jgi:hypothetical protein
MNNSSRVYCDLLGATSGLKMRSKERPVTMLPIVELRDAAFRVEQRETEVVHDVLVVRPGIEAEPGCKLSRIGCRADSV